MGAPAAHVFQVAQGIEQHLTFKHPDNLNAGIESSCDTQVLRRGTEEHAMKTITAIVAALLAVAALNAQSGPDPSGGAKKHHSRHPKDEVTLKGCVSDANGGYTLMQTDPGDTYELESRKIDLGAHLGEMVEVTGWESTSLSTSSDTLARGGSASPVTIMVTSIKTVVKECTPRVTANAVVTPVSGAQLQILSTPSDADIEIDGNFVGNTPSTVGVAAGQHQLAVKKNNYKPWERKIAVSSGQIRVDAVLEPQSKERAH
jgi:hypothetical protein